MNNQISWEDEKASKRILYGFGPNMTYYFVLMQSVDTFDKGPEWSCYFYLSSVAAKKSNGRIFIDKRVKLENAKQVCENLISRLLPTTTKKCSTKSENTSKPEEKRKSCSRHNVSNRTKK